MFLYNADPLLKAYLVSTTPHIFQRTLAVATYLTFPQMNPPQGSLNHVCLVGPLGHFPCFYYIIENKKHLHLYFSHDKFLKVELLGQLV